MHKNQIHRMVEEHMKLDIKNVREVWKQRGTRENQKMICEHGEQDKNSKENNCKK